MVLVTKNRAKKAIRSMVTQSMRETRGILKYKKNERARLLMLIVKAMIVGIKISDLIPSLFSPHGI
ncbi:MAG: hypothetical protein A3J69_00775 [Candidatus Levybacteria bacterium RIFCSPHIGHO2_02_FULL_42_12]|nr:MAG: hypothetical protein A3J69_00775 [Candidatus Levybacteria bacterium RIFCSPHIGHO2_02_FULL_42_12]OGH43078.1 MAG: hypothetical protein A3B53_03125 [Candidatus Levybacteria bacterium RIFCSPLOWO2_01_FULL_42_15]